MKKRADYPGKILVHAVDVKVGDEIFSPSDIHQHRGDVVSRIKESTVGTAKFRQFYSISSFLPDEHPLLNGQFYAVAAVVIVSRTREDMVD